jgi:peroxidase
LVREHNSVADRIRVKYPYLSGDQIYRMAQRVVISEIQAITWNEFLPVLLGNKAFPRYAGYDPGVDPGIATEFSTAGYRLGHTMLSPLILRLDLDGNPIPQGHLPLRDAFFSPSTLVDEGGLEPVLKGLSTGIMQRIDNMIVDDVRNFLFGAPGAGGLDLGSLNIQRGRDHGLPDYNTVRIHYGLAPKNSFSDINSEQGNDAAIRLAAAYVDVGNIDVWVGALAEEHFDRNILMGELLYTILQEQFERLRDGDIHWYQNVYSTSSQRALEKQTLAKVIARNTNLDRKDLQSNVFIAP